MSQPSIAARSRPHAGNPLRRLKPAWELLALTAREWWNDDIFRFAAALAFYMLFSLAPVLLTTVGIARFFFVPVQAENDIVTHVEQVVGAEGAGAVRQVIDATNVSRGSAWTVAAGIVTFFLGATVVFGELQAALNRIWDVQPKQSKGVFLQLALDRLRSFGIALAVGFLLVVSLIGSAVIDALQGYLAARLPIAPWFWQGANYVAYFLVLVLLFAMIYKYLPDVQLAWRDVWMGALVTAILFIAGKYGIGIYLERTGATITRTFGAAGSLAVLLVWIYYSAVICFFGAEFTQVYAKARGKKIPPESHAVRAGKKLAAS